MNRGRVLLVLVLTPLPSLVLSLLKEALPLSSPDAAVRQHWVFFIRAWIVTSLLDGVLLLQIREGVPRLQLKVGSVVFVALLAAGVSMTFIYGICSVFDTFPLPFGVLIAAPPNMGVVSGWFVYMSRHRWQADPSIWSDVKRQLYMLNSLVVLTFIYPIYIYGHVSLSGIVQASYVLILPVIKLFGKHLINHAFTGQTIAQPEAFVFNVDVLMSLYISSALQTASSWTTVAAIMALDLIHFWQTMIKIRKILGEVDTLLAKIPRGHAIARESFLQVAMRLINLEARQKLRCRKNAVMDLTLKQTIDTSTEMWAKSRRNIKSKTPLQSERNILMLMGNSKSHPMKPSLTINRARVFPIRPPHLRSYPTTAAAGRLKPSSSLGLEILFSSKERELFIQTTARVMFATEYILLTEYTEFSLPIIFSIHRAVLFYMPNRVYHNSMAELSSARLWSSVSSGLLYSLMEFISFIIVILVLNRKLRVSSVQQLGFVLDIQREEVQAKLVGVFVYVTQLSRGFQLVALANGKKEEEDNWTDVAICF